MKAINLGDLPNKPKQKYRKSSKLTLSIFAVITILTLGTALATSVTRNIVSSSSEFGQGKTTTLNCTSGDYVVITPQDNFVNSSGVFKLTGISITHIPASCLSKDFTIEALSNSGALKLDGNNSIATVIYTGADTNLIAGGISGTQAFNGSITSASGDSSSYGSFTISISTPSASTSNIARLVLQSQESTVGTVISTNSYGGGGGGAMQADCPPSEVVTSIELAAQTDQYGFLPSFYINCSLVTDLTSVYDQIDVVDSRNSFDSDTNSSIPDLLSSCGANRAGVGLDITPGGYVGDVGIRCADYPSGNNVVSNSLIDNHTMSDPSYCAPGSWLTGVYGRTGAGLDALGADCTPIGDL